MDTLGVQKMEEKHKKIETSISLSDAILFCFVLFCFVFFSRARKEINLISSFTAKENTKLKKNI